jgi:uncharacterized protein
MNFLKKVLVKIINLILFVIQKIFPENIQKEYIKIKTKENQKNLKIVQLSDFHYEAKTGYFQYKRLPDYLLNSAIELSNQENPDIVILTGDFVEFEWEPIEKLAKKLEKITSKFGIFACLGNHDHKTPESIEKITKSLTNSNIKVLINQSITIENIIEIVGKIKVTIKGMMDNNHPSFTEYKKLNDEMVKKNKIPRLIMAHNPNAHITIIKENWNFDLILSGHTHGGQISFPNTKCLHLNNQGYPLLLLFKNIIFLFPLFIQNLFPQKIMYWCFHLIKNWNMSKGLVSLKALTNCDNFMYINRGLGSHYLRIFTPPELTVIDLIGN